MWTEVQTPSLLLTCVGRDPGTQGNIFVAWPSWGKVAFVCQSLPALSKWLNTQGGALRAGSLYKVGRGLQRQHLGWRVERFSRSDLGPLNARLAGFSSLVFLTKTPASWIIEGAAASPRSEARSADQPPTTLPVES